MNRRKFLARTTGGAALAATGLPAASYARIAGANDRLSLGIIGCGGRGQFWLKQVQQYAKAQNVEVTALCDVWKVALEQTAQQVKTI